MKNNFEQISKVSGFMKHNGGLLFRDLSETEFEFKSTIQKIHLNINTNNILCYQQNYFAPVAQLDRALGYGPGGSGFKS